MKFLEEIVRLADRLDQVSYYELLGVEQSTSAATILERYYALAPRLHPDRYVRHCKPDEMSALNRVSARLGEARRVLSSPQLRAEYDAGLAKGSTRASNDQSVGRRGLKDEQDPRTPVARKFLEQAKQALAQKDYKRTRSVLDLALKYEPTSPAILEAVAQLEQETAGLAGAKKKPLAEATPIPGTLRAAEATPVPGTIKAATAAPVPAPTPVPEPALAPAVEFAREHPRFPVAVPVKLKADTRDKLETLVARDISAGGMFLKTTSKKLTVGATVTLMVTGPEDFVFEIPAEVVRVSGPNDTGGPGVGVRFQELPRATMDRIQEILADASAIDEVQKEPAPSEEGNLEWLVSEFLRLQALPAHEVLGVPVGANDREVALAYRELMRKYNPGRPTGPDAQAIIDICKQILAWIRGAHDSLTQKPKARAATKNPSSSMDETIQRERMESEVKLAVKSPAEVKPAPVRPGPPPPPAREVLSAEVFEGSTRDSSDLNETLLASEAYRLICDSKYEEALELLKEVPTGAKHSRLRAARHVARGYVAQRAGDRVAAQREFATALALDKTCLEAIKALRK